MTDLAAVALRGMPPTGRGVYLRDRFGIARAMGADFVCANAAHPNAIDHLRSAGGGWLYTMPSRWTPTAWRDGLAHILRVAQAARDAGVPVHGIIADPENEWPQLSRTRKESEARELGLALRAKADTLRIGVTTYPMFPAREPLVAALGDAAFYSPQLYHDGDRDTVTNPDVIASWYGIWTSLAGASHCIPSIAGYPSPRNTALQSPGPYRDYLASMPPSGGFIAWTQAGPTPTWMANALRTAEPGGSAFETFLAQARNFAFRPVVIGVATAILIVVLLLVALAGWSKLQ